MLKFHRIELTVKENSLALQVDVPEWELPILRAVHDRGEGSVDPVKLLEIRNVKREPPDAASEYERLKRRYGLSEGDDGKKGLPYVAIVYGQFGVGPQNLAKAIEASVTDAAETQDDLVGDLGKVA